MNCLCSCCAVQTVRQCFFYSQFFQDYMEHVRNMLLASNPLISAVCICLRQQGTLALIIVWSLQTASNALLEFCDQDLNQPVDEEVVSLLLLHTSPDSGVDTSLVVVALSL